jgi:hypothetical protein
MDELKETVETLIDLDEPEALLTTLKRAAEKQKGPRWQALAKALGKAEDELRIQQEMAKPVVEQQPIDSEAKAE